MCNSSCANSCGGSVVAKVPVAIRIEMFLYNLKMAIALFICPALRVYTNVSRSNAASIAEMNNKLRKEIRSRDKAIARLQKERRDLRYQVKILTSNLPAN